MTERDEPDPMAAPSRPAPGRVLLACVVAISLVLNVGGWFVYNQRGSGLGLMVVVLMMMLVVMATAVAGAVRVWFWRKPDGSRAQLVIGAGLALVSAALLSVNAFFLWTAEVCRTCA